MTISLSIVQTVLLVVVIFGGFLWMFALGVTVGRQFPEDNAQLSLLQHIALKLGYTHRKGDSSQNSQGTKPQFVEPGEMQVALTYHQGLTTPPPSTPSSSSQLVHGATKPQPSREKKPPFELSTPPTPPPAAPKEERERDIPTKVESIETTGERYTLLVASFKSPENAAKLEQILRAKGYNVSREETRINNETWHRVTVGTFDNRDVAMRFMGMFNEKERLRGVLIRR